MSDQSTDSETNLDVGFGVEKAQQNTILTVTIQYYYGTPCTDKMHYQHLM